MSKMFEAAKILSLFNDFLDFRKMIGTDHALVQIKQSFRLNPKLYQTVKLFSKLHMRFHLQCLSIGKTSTTYEMRMFDGKTGDELVVNHLRFVRMNLKTRKSSVFPQFYYEKYARFVGKPTTPFLESRSVPEVPQSAHVFQLTVRSSDMDVNGHSNQSAYIKFCMDCATDAALKKYYRHFDSDMCMYTTTRWEMDYVGESIAGDVLVISTWQSENNTRNIHFCIRSNGRNIFHASTFFDLEKQLSPAKIDARL